MPKQTEQQREQKCKLTVINAPKPLLQTLQVQFSFPGRVQPGPETLDSGIAFVLRLPKPSLQVGDEFGGAHDGGGIGYAGEFVRLRAATGDGS